MDVFWFAIMLANQKILIAIAIVVVLAASVAGVWFLIARDSSTSVGSENIKVKESSANKSILEEVLESPPRPRIQSSSDITLGVSDDEHRFYGKSKSLNIFFESYLDKDLITHVNITTDKKRFSVEFSKSGKISLSSAKVVFLVGGGVAPFDSADQEAMYKLARSLKPLLIPNSAVTINFSVFLGLLASANILKYEGSTLYYETPELQIKNSVPQDIIPVTQGTTMKSRDARRIADIKQLELALEKYFDANDGIYPAALSGLAPTFIPIIPIDPLTASAYKYCSFGTDGFNGTNSSKSDFHIGATLEDASNAALAMDGDVATDRCTTGSFNGNAVACTGAFAATPDSCYDITSFAP